MAATLRNSSDTSEALGLTVHNTMSRAAIFTPSENYDATFVVLRGFKYGTVTSATAYIYATSESKPTGPALATSQVVPGASLPLVNTDITFTFVAPVGLVSGTPYAIVLTAVADGGFNSWAWLSNASGIAYAAYNQGAGWISFAYRHHYEVWGTDPTRQISLSSPTDAATGITLQPLLAWTIGGAGATAGDLLDVYLKKDDSGFGADDLLGGLVDATLNTDWQIVGGLEYGATYYWQIQAADSTAGDLLSSAIYSFTVQLFYPPAVSTHPVSGLPTGANNMATVRRLIVAAKDKIYYEDLS